MTHPPFDDVASDPDSWLRQSDRHVIVGRVVWRAFTESLEDSPSNPQEDTAFLQAWLYHSGMAIELAAKAALIKRDSCFRDIGGYPPR